MTPRKKQHNKWHKELKQWFENSEIHWCEMCGQTTPPLDMAHSRKRYDIKTRAQYFEAVMLCRKHHTQIEHSGHEAMYETITAIINARQTAATLITS